MLTAACFCCWACLRETQVLAITAHSSLPWLLTRSQRNTSYSYHCSQQLVVLQQEVKLALLLHFMGVVRQFEELTLGQLHLQLLSAVLSFLQEPLLALQTLDSLPDYLQARHTSTLHVTQHSYTGRLHAMPDYLQARHIRTLHNT